MLARGESAPSRQKLVKVARLPLRLSWAGEKLGRVTNRQGAAEHSLMASNDGSRSGMRKQASIADLIVKGAIALVTTAFFIGAYLQFQVTFWLALIAALSVYISLLMLHTLMRRSEHVDALVSEVTRLEDELARTHPPAGAGSAPKQAARAPKRRGAPVPPGDVKTSPVLPTLKRRQQPTVAAPPLPPSLGPTTSAASAEPSARAYGPPAGGQQAPQAEPTLSPWPTATGQSDNMQDYWSFRPEKEAGQKGRPAASKTPAPKTSAPKKEEPPKGEQEGDLEAVQGMIKKLAKEVSLTSDGAPGAGEAGKDGAVRASLDALHTTADTMRAAAARSPFASARRVPAPGSPVPPPIAPGHARLSSLGEAVAAGRVEARLDPIVGLADHQLHHYEVAICPRDPKGAELPINAQDRQLAKTGLLPLIDCARLKWATQISQSLAEDGPKHSVFAAASAESLAAERFLDDIAKAYRQRQALAGELVLAFTLADVRTFSSVEWTALTDMRDLGFRFGLDAVTDLDYEFSALKAAGFTFVRIDAGSFLNGLAAPGGTTSGADICQQMSGLELTVIVSGIVDETSRAAVVDANVPLGQGVLFGPPVTVAPDSLSGAGSAAA